MSNTVCSLNFESDINVVESSTAHSHGWSSGCVCVCVCGGGGGGGYRYVVENDSPLCMFIELISVHGYSSIMTI